MADPDKIADMVTDRAAHILAPMQAEMDLNNWDAEFRVIMWDAIALMATAMAKDVRGEKQTVRHLRKR